MTQSTHLSRASSTQTQLPTTLHAKIFPASGSARAFVGHALAYVVHVWGNLKAVKSIL